MDYKTVFINLCLVLQQNRSWIKGLGKNPFTHSILFTHSLTAVPFVRGHRSVFPIGLRETPACIHVIQRLSQPRVACWRGFRPNSQKTECVFTRCPTCSRKKNCVYTRPPKRRGQVMYVAMQQLIEFLRLGWFKFTLHLRVHTKSRQYSNGQSFNFIFRFKFISIKNKSSSWKSILQEVWFWWIKQKCLTWWPKWWRYTLKTKVFKIN